MFSVSDVEWRGRREKEEEEEEEEESNGTRVEEDVGVEAAGERRQS